MSPHTFNVWLHFEKLSIMAKIWTRIIMILNWWKYISFLTDHPNAVQFFATIFKVLQTGRRRHQTFLAYIPNGNYYFHEIFQNIKNNLYIFLIPGKLPRPFEKNAYAFTWNWIRPGQTTHVWKSVQNQQKHDHGRSRYGRG